MTIKRNKFKCLILMLGALLTLGLQPLLVQANTTDVDSHFSVEMIETSDSKVGGEAVQVTVKNITNQTGKNILAKVDLPKNFADKLGKTSVTETVGTLAAGESKSFIISLSDGSTQALPTTGTSLPITGERVASLALIVGLVLLMSLGVILRKRKLTSLLFALLVITGGSVADASTTYHHAVTQTHQVTAAGQTLAFKTHISGDFGSTENDNPSDDKPIPNKYTIAFDLNYQTTETVPSQEVVANELAIQPTAPTRIGYNFEGWYENDAVTSFDFSTPIQKDITLYAKWTVIPFTITYELDDGANYDGAPISYTIESDTITLGEPTKTNYVFDGWFSDDQFNTQVTTIAQGSTGDITLYAKWEALIARVHFRSYNDTADVLPDATITATNPDLTIPDAPKADYCFLGWAESASAAETETLYVPDDDSIQSKLNVPDQTYLGYAVKPEHTIQNIAADTTLYAVYYKEKDAVTTAGDEFIWADAIWRNLKTDMDATIPGNQALVIKVAALTEKEATGSGATTGYYYPKFIESSQFFGSYPLNESSRYDYFSDTGENGYEASDNNVRLANNTYYNSLSAEDKASVNKVLLNNPKFSDFKDGITFGYGSDYSDWTWGGGPQSWYEDTRFETTVSDMGDKQAFALSYGDINTTMGLSGAYETRLLSFSENYDYWLRSAAHHHAFAGYVHLRRFDNDTYVSNGNSVRPALSLQIN